MDLFEQISNDIKAQRKESVPRSENCSGSKRYSDR